MESVFIVIVGILFLLAALDLVVGVSNDAVNFLVSAVGSRAASFRVILLVASLGVLIGAVFSGGMMEVARKGVFHPELFTFGNIMIIFLAVMLTDVILLDIFNSLGMPTSTTVSLVFELLGAAVAVSIVKILHDGGSLSEVGSYINSGKALVIIGGILFSVVVAFTFGSLIQYLSRLLFSFDISKTFVRYGALWGGISVTAITYFTLVTGLKGSIFADIPMTDTQTLSEWTKAHTLEIMAVSLLVWTALMAVLQFVFKVNTLKIIVLLGTFALAMSFAGNDLVNFIGVPLAGFDAYKSWASSGIGPETFMMTGFNDKIQTPTLFLILAGIIMIVTLWLSKKAKRVTETSLNLSRQDSGIERFESSAISRSIVRLSLQTSKFVEDMIPKKIQARIDNRFTRPTEKTAEPQQAFDLVRASVNLMVSGILISLGTAYKLPLSTTYVTFMVAMGTSLADRAWGRESAVYRVSGVLAVIAGWFITALVAFTVAFVLANLIIWGGIIAIALILLLAGVSMYRSQFLNRKAKIQAEESKTLNKDDNLPPQIKYKNDVIEVLGEVSTLFRKTIKALTKEDRKKLKHIKKANIELNDKTGAFKKNVYEMIQQFTKQNIHSGPSFVQVLDYLREITHAMYHVIKPSFEHIDNNHVGMNAAQTEELLQLSEAVVELFNEAVDIIKTENFDKLANLSLFQKKIIEQLDSYRENHIERIKTNEIDTRNSVLYLNILAETKNIMLYMSSLTKAQRSFTENQNPN